MEHALHIPPSEIYFFSFRYYVSDIVRKLSYSLQSRSPSYEKIVLFNSSRHKTKMSANIENYSRLSSDMMKMYRDRTFGDVTIKLHDGELSAFSVMLIMRCKVFAASLSLRWKKNSNTILIKDCRTKIMKIFIEYLYSAVLKVEDLNILELHELKDVIRRFGDDEMEGLIDSHIRVTNVETFDDEWRRRTEDPNFFPSEDEFSRALRLVKTGNLQSYVIEEFLELFNEELRYLPTPETVKMAAILAYQGAPLQVEELRIDDEIIESVPRYLLQPLVSCAAEKDVKILTNPEEDSVLDTILDNVYSKELDISGQQMKNEKTEKLVTAMRDRVEELAVTCSRWSADIDTLIKYEGMGRCRKIKLQIWDNISLNQRKILYWAEYMRWSVRRFSDPKQIRYIVETPEGSRHMIQRVVDLEIYRP